MSVIRIPDWSEILARGAPWGLLLRSGTTGAWLLRQTAAEDDVDAALVAGRACATSADLFDEWRHALELEERCDEGWDTFLGCVGDAARAAPRAILVLDAEHVLEDEPARLPTLLQGLRVAEERAAEGEGTLRIVFQSRFDHARDRLAVFHEHGAVDIV